MLYRWRWLPVLAWLLLVVRPLPIGRLRKRPAARPATSYAEALQRVDEIWAGERRLALHALGGTRLWAHGQGTPQVAVLLHGYGNSPQQLAGLGERLYAQGWNIFAPRMPLHGLADRLTDQLGGLTAEALADWAEDALDLAIGLGGQVRVFGFSAGGAAALWLAQTRPEVDRTVILSAFLGLRVVPAWLHRPFVHLFLHLPAFAVWWDPLRRAGSPYTVDYAYPRFSLRDLAQVLRLGAALEWQAQHQAPAGRLVFMLNDHDPGVSNARLLRLAKTWQRGGGQVVLDHFRATEIYLHDVLAPGTPGAPFERMYVRIAEWLLQ